MRFHVVIEQVFSIEGLTAVLTSVAKDTREMNALYMLSQVTAIRAELATNCAFQGSWARSRVLYYILIKLLCSLAMACKENESRKVGQE